MPRCSTHHRAQMLRAKVAIAFRRVLRELRRQKGLSQERLASLGDFDPTYASLLERGLRTPTLTIIFRLADVLETHPWWLVKRAYEEAQPP